MTPHGLVRNLIDGGIVPDHPSFGDPTWVRQIRTTNACLLILLFASPPTAALYISVGAWPLAMAVGVPLTVSIVSLVMIRRGWDSRPVAHANVFLFLLLLVFLQSQTGGIRAPGQGWVFVPALYAGLALGAASAVLYTTLALLGVGCFAAVDAANIALPSLVAPHMLGVYTLSVELLLGLVLLTIVHAFLMARSEAEEILVERARLAEMTTDVKSALSQEEMLEESLQRCAQVFVDGLGVAFARIWTLNDAEQTLELQASAGMYTHRDGAHGRVPVGHLKIGRIAQERLPHLTNEVLGDPRIGDQAWAAREGMVAFAGYPLVNGDRLLGVLAMFSRAALSETQIRTLEPIAEGIGVAIDRRRTDAALQKTARELAKARDEALAANQAKSEFLATVSHEIRTPIHGTLGMLELLLDGSPSPDQRERTLHAQRTSLRLRAIVDDILDFSKIEAGKLGLEQADFEVESLMDAAAAVVAPAAAAKGLALRQSIDPAVPGTLRGDVGRVEQILLNFMGNAVKFTDEGHVAVDVRLVAMDASHASLRFSVSDSGIGIPAESLSRVFESFSQVDGTSTRRHGGTGLGLSIAKRLAELMGGEVGVESTLGEGSTFWFTVRLQYATPKSDVPVELLPGSEAPGRGGSRPQYPIRVLVVDDDEVNRLVGRELLDALGAVVDVACDGAEAVEAIRQRPYDLVLMDVRMPNVDGLEATREIRRVQGAESRSVVVALTASVREEDRQRCAAASMDDFLSKPISGAALEALLQRWRERFERARSVHPEETGVRLRSGPADSTS